jgi:hypothetical protein
VENLKDKYVRSIISLGNSKAMTFPQEWTNLANLEEKSEVKLYPIDEKTLVIRAGDVDEPKSFIINEKWPPGLIKQAIISAFKLNVDEIFIKYNEKNEDLLNEILIELGSELIGLDYKNLMDKKEFYIRFLVDPSRITLPEILMDLSNVFTTIIKNVVEGTKKKNDRLLAEIDKKYSLGTRILITGLSDFPSKGYRKLPTIRFLGDRVVLLYIRDFIYETLVLQSISLDKIRKYSDLLLKIPNLLSEIITNYEKINFDTVSRFQLYLVELKEMLKGIPFESSDNEELQVRNTVNYYLNSFRNFFDIGITRLIESLIGMV